MGLNQKMILAFCFWLFVSLWAFGYAVNQSFVGAEHFLLPLLVASGIFIFVHHPFRVYGQPSNTEFASLLVIMTCVVIYSIIIFIMPRIESANGPNVCSLETPQGYCYRLPESLCRTIWLSYESSCKSDIQSRLGERATALIGSSVKKCTGKKFDKDFYYTRMNTSESVCINYYKSLKD